MFTNEVIPQDVIPIITSNLSLYDQRLLNKQHYQSVQYQFKRKNKHDLLNFIKSENDITEFNTLNYIIIKDNL